MDFYPYRLSFNQLLQALSVCDEYNCFDA